jgi:hypothetical protein
MNEGCKSVGVPTLLKLCLCAAAPESPPLCQYLYFCTSKASTFVLVQQTLGIEFPAIMISRGMTDVVIGFMNKHRAHAFLDEHLSLSIEVMRFTYPDVC